MIEKFKNNWNLFFSIAIGNLGIANMMLLIEREVNLSLIMFAIVGVLIGMGTLYNMINIQSKCLIELCENQRYILNELKNDRKYEYKKDGATVMLNKAELLNKFMNEEKGKI